MNGAELCVLGAGTIVPQVRRGPAGFALRAAAGAPWVLLDCGPGSVRALGELGIAVGDVAAVVLTHFHPDHCLDLFALLFARRNPELAGVGELRVIAPPGLARVIAGSRESFGNWLEGPSVRFDELALDAHGRWSGALEVGSARIELSATLNGHTPHALSLRATLPSGFVLAYSGDTGEDARVASLVHGADLFVCECAFPSDREPGKHLNPPALARLARAAGVRRVLVTHCYPALAPSDAVRELAQLDVAAFAGHDGLRLPLVRGAG